MKEFDEEFNKHRSQLRAFIFRISANADDTDDLVQDTYIKASSKRDTFRGESSLKTWIFSIAVNLVKDHLRAKKRWPVNAMDLAREESMAHADEHMPRFMAIHSTPFGKFELREHINLCFTCIGKTLPIEQQLAILLKEIFGFKVNEISTILNKTEGVVKHALLDGRNTMNDIFEQRCSLISKTGVCHQCSELNGIFNPRQDFQEQKLKAGLHNENDKSKEELFDLRARIAGAINPFDCDGRDLGLFHFEHISNVLIAKESQ